MQETRLNPLGFCLPVGRGRQASRLLSLASYLLLLGSWLLALVSFFFLLAKAQSRKEI